MFGQCGILEMFGQCGILEMVGQCGIFGFIFLLEFRTGPTVLYFWFYFSIGL
jgi:hypothetical protein